MKIIINGLGGQHDLNVSSSFIQGYESVGGTWTGLIEMRTDSLSSSLSYAKNNDFSIVVRSTTGASSYTSLALDNYPQVLTVMPAGSNNYELIFTDSIPNVILITGGGDINNETGYSIEFFSPDPVNIEPDYSSYSNGYIAGQIAYIMGQLSCTSWEARYRAQMTANENGIWDIINGYGLINIIDAISYTGYIPTDPFIETPLGRTTMKYLTPIIISSSLQTYSDVGITGSLNILRDVSSSLVRTTTLTASKALITDLTASKMNITDTLTVNILVSSSTNYTSGSVKIGNNIGNEHQITGSIYVTGSLNIKGYKISNDIFETTIEGGQMSVGFSHSLAPSPTGLSFAQGYQNQAIGIGSHAEGQNVTSSADYSHAEGAATLASGTYSHAEGRQTVARAIGSHAEGYLTIASGVYSHAEGDTTIARGEIAHAEGISTLAQGDSSHAEGISTLAQGYASHAEGNGTVAKGDISHAEGRQTVASGSYSHAQGYLTIASGSYSFTSGIGVLANSYCEQAFGLYNTNYSQSSAISLISSDRLFVIGNGTSNSVRQDVLKIYKSGKTEFTGSIYITGSLNISGHTEMQSGSSIILSSPNGTKFMLTVSDTGVVSSSFI